MNNQQLIIYRAGSLTRAFTPLVAAFTCQTGIQVKDIAMGSVDAARQITAGGQPADLYAPADYKDIDLFLKPAGYADFNIVFAQGRMVLAYSANSVAEKKLPPIVAPGSQPFHPPDSIPDAAPEWYAILTMPGVVIGGGHPFLDPGAYRADMIFQLAQEYYQVPNLYNNLLKHLMIPGPGNAGVLLSASNSIFSSLMNTMLRRAPSTILICATLTCLMKSICRTPQRTTGTVNTHRLFCRDSEPRGAHGR